ncbi:hypothetical protein CC80DRAFT_139128 [Byssothecium circinans]|uniref:RNase H type-1 domain-containing protein n=1 Tax=Byssothecium circinans TaxID=147558 RepID=A0A6A5TSV5_9PLEO|nr:hypothetical protein CC80DRAFT_139128 [Byssothecium circinans]
MSSAPRERVDRLRASMLGPGHNAAVYYKGAAAYKFVDEIEAFGGHGTDADLLNDLPAAELDKTLVLWTDASCKDGYLGASVVWRGKTGVWEGRRYPLGYKTGYVADAEMFAVAAALRYAVEARRMRGRDIMRVRIFTDSQTVLLAAKEGGWNLPIGPLAADVPTLIEFYQCVHFLECCTVKVELRKVAGHANSEGNRQADAAARTAADQAREKGRQPMVVPEFFERNGEQETRSAKEDWIAEWRWRLER